MLTARLKKLFYKSKMLSGDEELALRLIKVAGQLSL